MPRCAGKKGDGTPCERIVGSSQEYCYAHDPSYAEDRKRAASKAAKSPAQEPLQLGDQGDHRDGSRTSTLPCWRACGAAPAAAVANQIANAQLRAIELERRVREQDELEERLDELEDLWRRQKGVGACPLVDTATRSASISGA